MNKQYVVCAANRNEITGLIICGARHWDDLMCAQADAAGCNPMTYPNDDPWEQGFIDQFGKFLTRQEAATIVMENKQKLNGELGGEYQVNYLFSEHLY